MATTFALPAVKNKIPDISNLVKKKKKKEKKKDYMQKNQAFKRKLLIMIMINILLFQNSTS